GRAALAAMSDAVFAGEAEGGRGRQPAETLRQAAAASLVLLATKGAADTRPDPLPPPDENVEAESTLDQLVPRSLAAKDRAAAVVVFSKQLERAASRALASIGQRGDAKSVAAVAKVMRTHEGWAMRVLAAQALGRLGASGKGDAASKDAAKHLEEAAKKEAFALVREAALVALASFDKTSAGVIAAQMEK